MRRIEITCSDKAQLTSTRSETPEGFLRAMTALTTVGVQDYLGSELPAEMGFKPGEMVGVFRPPTTVFHPDTIATAQLKPITYQHPSSGVYPDNFRLLSVGHLGESVAPLDEKRLGAPAMIMDAAVVDMLGNGEYETSLGYNAVLVEDEGTYEGKPYKLRFDGPMLVNHLAIVEQGRCGKSVKILDKGVKEMTKEEVQGLISDALAAHKPAFKDEDIKGAVATAIEAGLKPLADRVAEIAAKVEAKDQPGLCPECKKGKMVDGVCDACNYKATKDAAPNMNDAVAARIGLLDACRPLLSEADSTKALEMTDRQLIVAALGDSVKDAEGKSDEYLKGMLDLMLADRKAAVDDLKDKSNRTGNDDAVTEPIGGLGARDL